jgi:hypothetical protein
MLRPLTKWHTSSARFLAWSPARSQRLRHENDLQAGMARNILGILNMPQEDDIA